jgi:hypothetical protein
MLHKTRELFERVAGPLRLVSNSLAVGRCPSCGTEHSLFIDLQTGDWRCGGLPDALVRAKEATEEQKSTP